MLLSIRTTAAAVVTHTTEDDAQPRHPTYVRQRNASFERVVRGKTSFKATTSVAVPVESNGPFDPQSFLVQQSTCELRRRGGCRASGDWLTFFFMAALSSRASIPGVPGSHRESARCPSICHLVFPWDQASSGPGSRAFSFVFGRSVAFFKRTSPYECRMIRTVVPSCIVTAWR